MTKKCVGCGITLQSNDNKVLGYIPIEKEKDAKYCERCFKIIHYNKNEILELPKDVSEIVKEVNKNAKYAFFLIDFLNINKDTINKFKTIKCPKTLIISKSDIIPKSIKSNKIIELLSKEYQIQENIEFISSNRNRNINCLTKIMDENKIKEAYILGFTNSGKSTLINEICKKYIDDVALITTSPIPNTTLDFIEIKLNDNYTLIDTPGFITKTNFYEIDELSLIKKINYKKYINPITFQSKEGTYINIENHLIIKTTDNKNSLTFYMSNNLNIKKEYKLTNNSLIEITLEIPENSDLVIKGIGFINIKKKCKITIYTKNEELLEVRESLF